MEELQRKKTSRKGYQSHLTHLMKKVDAIMDSESRPSEKDIAVLTNYIMSAQCCLKKWTKRLPTQSQGEDDLEAEIIESAAIQEAISDN